MRRAGIAVFALLWMGCAGAHAHRGPPSEAGACPGCGPTTDQHETAGPMGQPAHAACPMIVQGTTVRAEPVDGGAALVFTTAGDVDALRAHVARMAQMHEYHRAHGGRMGGDGRMGGGRMMMGMTVPATARAEDIDAGARIVFTPDDPGQLDVLRDEVGRLAARMGSGQCPMSSADPGEQPGTSPPGA